MGLLSTLNVSLSYRHSILLASMFKVIILNSFFKNEDIGINTVTFHEENNNNTQNTLKVIWVFLLRAYVIIFFSVKWIQTCLNTAKSKMQVVVPCTHSLDQNHQPGNVLTSPRDLSGNVICCNQPILEPEAVYGAGRDFLVQWQSTHTHF